MKRSLFLLAAIATVVALAPKPGYAHRYFDTWAARWTTPDPMLDLYPGWSPYSYGLDNPLRNVDPSGDTTYAYNQNHDLVPIDNSPDMISWGRQNPNYVSGNFTWFTDFNWVMVDPIYGRFHNMRTQIIPTANGARWYEPKPTVNMGVFDLPIGPPEAEASQTAELSLSKVLDISPHAAGRMELYGITDDMIKAAISKGERFFDPKNGSVVYIIRGGFGSGQDLLVARNPITGVIKTVTRDFDLAKSRFIPLK